MSDWPAHAEACEKCTGDATLYAYGARGYCNRCYRLIKHIEEVQAWDRSRPESLRTIPADGLIDPSIDPMKPLGLITDIFTDNEFEISRNEIIRQLKGRLSILRYREEIRRREVPVNALMLEQEFSKLLRIVRRTAKYPHNASFLNQYFNEEERRVIYALLEEIIEQVPWRGIEWSRVFERIRSGGT